MIQDLQIRWFAEPSHRKSVAHALVGEYEFDEFSPVCMGPNGTIGGIYAEDKYRHRCAKCVKVLSAELDAVLDVPTKPVVLKFTIYMEVKPDKISHADDLVRSYFGRTKTFHEAGGAPAVSYEIEEK